MEIEIVRWGWWTWLRGRAGRAGAVRNQGAGTARPEGIWQVYERYVINDVMLIFGGKERFT